MRYYIGIDSGTQSTKALVCREDGAVVGRGQAPHELISGLPLGHKEQHPSTWIEALKTAIDQASRESDINPRDVAAIGVAGQQHGFVPLDKNGNVIRPAKLWNDTSTAPEAAEIVRAAGGIVEYILITGNALPPGF